MTDDVLKSLIVDNIVPKKTDADRIVSAILQLSKSVSAASKRIVERLATLEDDLADRQNDRD